MIDDTQLKPSKRFYAYWQQIEAKRLNKVEHKSQFKRYRQQPKYQKN